MFSVPGSVIYYDKDLPFLFHENMCCHLVQRDKARIVLTMSII